MAKTLGPRSVKAVNFALPLGISVIVVTLVLLVVLIAVLIVIALFLVAAVVSNIAFWSVEYPSRQLLEVST